MAVNYTSAITLISNFARNHPVSTGFTALQLALTPFLGVGWVLALPLRALGFGAGGVGLGKSPH